MQRASVEYPPVVPELTRADQQRGRYNWTSRKDRRDRCGTVRAPPPGERSRCGIVHKAPDQADDDAGASDSVSSPVHCIPPWLTDSRQ
jgi:hypothetical protein